jgi:23S rRNA (guanine2445-N2)-methyltransferase / 23S rRNA (guanine2069-N7)-methyltransferase
MKLFVTCTRYLETLLLGELQTFGAEECAETRAGVSCAADLEGCYRIALWSRLASRVLLLLHEGPVHNEDEIYSLACDIPWEQHFTHEQSFAVFADTVRSPVRNASYAALKVKDAVADRFRSHEGRRPSVDAENPAIRIRLNLSGEHGRLYLDLSGESLHKRGYRLTSTEAPLRETAAAGVLLRAGWPAIAAQGGVFIDPMCGSGTLAVEAALIASDTAPGLLRESFGFHNWKGHDDHLWKQLTSEAHRRRTEGLQAVPPLYASDIDAESVSATERNIDRAGFSEHIELQHSDFRDLDRSVLGIPAASHGLVAVNPPYGIRLEKDRYAAAIYKVLGQWLSQHFSGFQATVLAPDKATSKGLGLRASKINTLYNGNLKIIQVLLDLGPENRFLPQDTSSPERSEAPLPKPDDDPTSGVNTVINRLKKNRRSLKSYLKKNDVSCYRIYDADIPQYSAAIDVYENEHFVIQEYAPPKTVPGEQAEVHLRELLGAVVHYFSAAPDHVYVKQRRRQRGTSQYERSDTEGERFIVREGGLKFFVNFTDYLDTGLFLDHRITRSMIRDLADDTRFLNLFAYTCTASVYASAGGARQTVSVDTSSTYLDWGKQNFRLNRFDPESHRFIRRDVFSFLHTDAGLYELIFIDPPTFSNRKGNDSDFDVQRDHSLLIDLAAQRLSDNGIIIFSNNYRRFELDPELYDRYRVEDITEATIPSDFNRNPGIHRIYWFKECTREANGGCSP